MATIQLAALPTSVAFAIRRITENPDGSVEVAFTSGPPPLPLGESGVITFQSRAILEDQVKEMVATITNDLMLNIYLAKVWLKADGTFKNLQAPGITGKTLTIDPAAIQPVAFA